MFRFQKQPPGVFYKKGVLRISQNSQDNTCARVSFLKKLQAWGKNNFKTIDGDITKKYVVTKSFYLRVSISIKNRRLQTKDCSVVTVNKIVCIP